MKSPAALEQFNKLNLTDASQLYFTDLQWEDGGALAEPYYDFIHGGVGQFAFSARRDLWILFDEWNPAEEPYVIFFGHGSEGTVYAKCFRDFLIRRTIEEYTNSWYLDEQPDVDKADQFFRTYPDKLRPIIGDDAAQALQKLIEGRSLKVDDGVCGYLSEDEMLSASKELIGFDEFDAEVQLDRDAPDYDGMKRPGTN